jgi:hypothetical protein
VRREVDVADGPVGEGQAQAMVADHLDSGDVNELFHAHDLGERLDGLQLLLAPGALPVGLQLGSVEACPLGHKCLCAPRERTCKYVAVEVNRRGLPSVARVEMRSCVVSLVPVHVDGDAEKKLIRGTAAPYEPDRPGLSWRRSFGDGVDSIPTNPGYRGVSEGFPRLCKPAFRR